MLNASWFSLIFEKFRNQIIFCRFFCYCAKFHLSSLLLHFCRDVRWRLFEGRVESWCLSPWPVGYFLVLKKCRRHIGNMFMLNVGVLSLLVIEYICQWKKMSLIMMPYNITLEGCSYFSCYKTGRNTMEH